ncbi:alkaline ceramidase family protein [Ophiostoma piceae UAMH 11346]|uniref:Alkaline ceramidase family protein n=1 Tax=Ophiostoma piceae (strain UAMH 11346) TaxID=1262450 RepID=S3C7K5_OPHP1|nr:alkaline ceramidase family protein [Ophiostoma piceae UAMH 11346]
MGHHNRHFSGDRYAAAGVWGTPTSTANFCEEDYAITLYIAEFINTLTNLAYIYYAVQHPGPRRRVRRSPNGAWDYTAPHWTQPDFFAVSLWVLGILSLVFHATLKHATQYGDELAMLVLAGALLQGSWGPQSRAAALVSWSTVVAASALYLRTGEILHQVYCFQSMILVAGIRTVYLMWGLKKAEAAHEAKGTKDESGKITAADALRNWLTSLATLAFAYFLWHIDLEACGLLRRMRTSLGLPFAWLLELHGWWHILTALGASMYVQLLRELSYE